MLSMCVRHQDSIICSLFASSTLMNEMFPKFVRFYWDIHPGMSPYTVWKGKSLLKTIGRWLGKPPACDIQSEQIRVVSNSTLLPVSAWWATIHHSIYENSCKGKSGVAKASNAVLSSSLIVQMFSSSNKTEAIAAFMLHHHCLRLALASCFFMTKPLSQRLLLLKRHWLVLESSFKLKRIQMEGLQDVFVRIQTWNLANSNSSKLSSEIIIFNAGVTIFTRTTCTLL